MCPWFEPRSRSQKFKPCRNVGLFLFQPASISLRTTRAQDMITSKLFWQSRRLVGDHSEFQQIKEQYQ
ncbi:MAG: hypothetical protein CVU27_02100 [Betaproteobacteria bacterium HGW-Betaproteobacteria-20]|nr:MAG: hypothetical protein CVU27_02100 [Betaproteobacteria bacterium HGW-Betaproteobacteria-20]